MKHITKKIPLNSIIELMLIILKKMAEKKRKKRALEFRFRKLTENELYQFSYGVANNLDDCVKNTYHSLRKMSLHAALAALTSFYS